MKWHPVPCNQNEPPRPVGRETHAMDAQDELTPAQRGLGDMGETEFRAAARRVVDRVADDLDGIERRDVLPRLAPGAVRARLPAAAPAEPEPLERILEDYRELIEPNLTHWQSPGFMAYFPSVASRP